jgi:hypothetical protein
MQAASPQRREHRPAAFIESDSGRQPVDRVRIRKAPHAALEVGDATRAQARRSCQFFLGQACRETVSTQLLAEL